MPPGPRCSPATARPRSHPSARRRPRPTPGRRGGPRRRRAAGLPACRGRGPGHGRGRQPRSRGRGPPHRPAAQRHPRPRPAGPAATRRVAREADRASCGARHPRRGRRPAVCGRPVLLGLPGHARPRAAPSRRLPGTPRPPRTSAPWPPRLPCRSPTALPQPTVVDIRSLQSSAPPAAASAAHAALGTPSRSVRVGAGAAAWLVALGGVGTAAAMSGLLTVAVDGILGGRDTPTAGHRRGSDAPPVRPRPPSPPRPTRPSAGRVPTPTPTKRSTGTTPVSAGGQGGSGGTTKTVHAPRRQTPSGW